MFEICRACMKSINIITKPYYQFSNNSLSEDERLMFTTIIPEMDLNIPTQLFFCDACNISLQNAYKFKLKCRKTEECILKYVNGLTKTNLEHFDLKAVAFECSDILGDLIVENDGNCTKHQDDDKVVYTSKKLHKESDKNMLNVIENITIKSGEYQERYTEHDVSNVYSPGKKVNTSVSFEHNSLENTYSTAHNPQIHTHYSGMNNQALQNNYIIIKNTNLSQINTVFQNFSNQKNVHEDFYNHPISNGVDMNVNKYSNFYKRNIFSENYHHDQYKPPNFGCVHKDKMVNINSSFDGLYKKRKCIDNNIQLENTNLLQKKIKVATKSNGELLIKNTPILQQNTSNLEKLLIKGKHNTQQNYCNNNPENVLKCNSEIALNKTDKSFLIGDNISNQISKNTSPDEQIFKRESETSVELIEIYHGETKIETKISTEAVLNENNNIVTVVSKECKKGLDNFPIYKDIIDPKLYDTKKKQMEQQLTKTEAKFAEVIPHLKKFYVCHVCRKLLSTRFYAFHMKIHE